MAPSDESEEEIVPDPSEALEFEPVKRIKPKRHGIWVFLLMVLIGGGVGAGWHFYGGLLVGGENDEIPVIRAAEGPVKVRPETPGGMAIPNRDKMVYDRMNGGIEEPRIERLLPPPEMPKTPPVPVAEPQSAPEPVPVPKPETRVAEAVPVIEKTKQLAKPQKLEPGKVDLKKLTPKKTEPEIAEPAVVVNQDMVPKQPETQTSKAIVTGLAYQIQIAAVRTYEQAEGEWARLKKKHGDLLGGYSLNIVRVDLGADKGIFFRLRAGPIAGEDVAQALCQNLSKRKVGCLIVRPGG